MKRKNFIETDIYIYVFLNCPSILHVFSISGQKYSEKTLC